MYLVQTHLRFLYETMKVLLHDYSYVAQGKNTTFTAHSSNLMNLCAFRLKTFALFLHSEEIHSI